VGKKFTGQGCNKVGYIVKVVKLNKVSACLDYVDNRYGLICLLKVEVVE